LNYHSSSKSEAALSVTSYEEKIAIDG